MSEGLMTAIIFILAFGWILLVVAGIISGMFFSSLKAEAQKRVKKAVQRAYYKQRRKEQLRRAEMLRERAIQQFWTENYYGEGIE